MSRAKRKKRKALTQEHKDNLSKGLKGKNVGEKNPMFGKKNPAHAERMRQQIGPKHPRWVEKIQKICPVCGIDFKVYPLDKNQKCCSNECNAKTRIGEKNGMFGKHHSQKSKDKMKEARLGKYAGEECPAYIDGRSYFPYPLKFSFQLKKSIRHRDGYKCQKCGCPEIKNNTRLPIHHIDYNKQNCLIINLISLCKRCNSEVNINRKKWTRYFQRKLQKKQEQQQLYLSIS